MCVEYCVCVECSVSGVMCVCECTVHVCTVCMHGLLGGCGCIA